MKFKINVDEPSMILRLEKRMEEIEDKIALLDTKLNDLFVDSGVGETYEISNPYYINVKPVNGKIKIDYDLSTLGKGDLIAAKVELFGINEYDSRYKITSSNKLKMTVDIDVADFPLIFSFEYREVVNGNEVVYRKNIDIKEVVTSINDTAKIVTPFDDKVITLKDSVNILKNQINFLLKEKKI
jgi:hypothetical protein